MPVDDLRMTKAQLRSYRKAKKKAQTEKNKNKNKAQTKKVMEAQTKKVMKAMKVMKVMKEAQTKKNKNKAQPLPILISQCMAKVLHQYNMRPRLMSLVTPYLQPELSQIVENVTPRGGIPRWTIVGPGYQETKRD